MRPLTLDGAERRLTLMLSRFVGGGYVAYLVVCLPELSQDATLVARWFTPIAVAVAFGPGVALLIATFTRHWDRWYPLLAWLAALGYLAAVGLWFVAWNGGRAADLRGTWLVVFPGLASLTLTLVRPRAAAFIHLPVAGLAVLTANALSRSAQYGTNMPLWSVLWSLFFSMVFVIAATMALRAGSVLDATREQANRLAAQASAESARNLENARFDDLIHDRVLAVLVTVADGRADVEAATQARLAMDALDDDTDLPGSPVNFDDFRALVTSSVQAVDPAIPVSSTATGPRGAVTVPAHAAEAMALAAAEAVRNARRHAGDSADPCVVIRASGPKVTVTITDDGLGFDALTVRGDRMGLEFSIGRRMTSSDGWTTVRSALGAGTEVVLGWPR